MGWRKVGSALLPPRAQEEGGVIRDLLLALAGLTLVSAAFLAFQLRRRPRKPRLEVLSGNAASGAFRDSRLEEEARRRA